MGVSPARRQADVAFFKTPHLNPLPRVGEGRVRGTFYLDRLMGIHIFYYFVLLNVTYRRRMIKIITLKYPKV